MSDFAALKRAFEYDPSFLDYGRYYVDCPECSSVYEDDQYQCTTCDGAGDFNLVYILKNMLKE